jgi:hypothetical protein
MQFLIAAAAITDFEMESKYLDGTGFVRFRLV